MLPINKKIIEILKLNFSIKHANISANTNLIKEFDLCDWELELLYSKLEIAFDIEIKEEVPKGAVCLGQLQKIIRENIYEKKQQNTI